MDSSTVVSPTNLFVDSCVTSIALSSCDAFRIIPAGISSHPISKRKSPLAFPALNVDLELFLTLDFFRRLMPGPQSSLEPQRVDRATRVRPASRLFVRAQSSQLAPSPRS